METKILIKNAYDLESEIHEKLKQEKFDQMITRQLDAIQRTMERFENGCNFFFADKNNYKAHEVQWFTEFYEAARQLFEDGEYYFEYRSRYEYICW